MQFFTIILPFILALFFIYFGSKIFAKMLEYFLDFLSKLR